MKPHNELAAGSDEAYCLAEPGEQYMLYAPNGGRVKLDLRDAKGRFDVEWLDPHTGKRLGRSNQQGGEVFAFNAPDEKDWVLFVTKTIPPATLD